MESELCATRSTLQVKDWQMSGRQDIIGVKLSQAHLTFSFTERKHDWILI